MIAIFAGCLLASIAGTAYEGHHYGVALTVSIIALGMFLDSAAMKIKESVDELGGCCEGEENIDDGA